MEIRTHVSGCLLVLAICCLNAAAADFKDVEYGQVDGVHLTLDAHVPDGMARFPQPYSSMAEGGLPGTNSNTLRTSFSH